jgi:2-polyprenyl-6-methoxyphenol hydroxylase-like FAD-dependent oxidoreductase
MDSPDNPTRITLVGAGTIGLSFAALYLKASSKISVTICDTRPDLDNYARKMLQGYFIL